MFEKAIIDKKKQSTVIEKIPSRFEQCYLWIVMFMMMIFDNIVITPQKQVIKARITHKNFEKYYSWVAMFMVMGIFMCVSNDAVAGLTESKKVLDSITTDIGGIVTNWIGVLLAAEVALTVYAIAVTNSFKPLFLGLGAMAFTYYGEKYIDSRSNITLSQK